MTDACPTCGRPLGRPGRKYASNADKQRAYRARKKLKKPVTIRKRVRHKVGPDKIDRVWTEYQVLSGRKILSRHGTEEQAIWAQQLLIVGGS